MRACRPNPVSFSLSGPWCVLTCVCAAHPTHCYHGCQHTSKNHSLMPRYFHRYGYLANKHERCVSWTRMKTFWSCVFSQGWVYNVVPWLTAIPSALGGGYVSDFLINRGIRKTVILLLWCVLWGQLEYVTLKVSFISCILCRICCGICEKDNAGECESAGRSVAAGWSDKSTCVT